MASLTHVNPTSMFTSPAFSQGVLVESPARLLVVGGQNGVDAGGRMVGDDTASQTMQAMRNLLTVLREVGAGPEDVAKLTVYLVAGQDAKAGFAASRQVWGDHPTAVTVVYVAVLARPDALVEVEALAVLSRDR
ncbi:MAG: RidA family protein [Mycobacterium leprae]